MKRYFTERVAWNLFATISSLFGIFSSLFVRPMFPQFHNLYVSLFTEFDENPHRDTAERHKQTVKFD